MTEGPTTEQPTDATNAPETTTASQPASKSTRFNNGFLQLDYEICSNITLFLKYDIIAFVF